ncbi:MAG: radical SAM protein, partial [Polyangiaceae bacterium]|nr:radical SAM protein [Polyangiaceae bacterium]
MSAPERPFTLVAELTYRCPLRCAYCANPLTWSTHGDALDAAAWCALFVEAAGLGVVQVHLTGGEPLLRSDLEAIVAGARRADLYTNLVTSGVPLGFERLCALRAAGVDAIQLSFQDVDPRAAERIGGGRTLAEKRQVASWAREQGIPLTVNVVIHRENIERIEDFIALAESVGAHRLELANAQYLGWALLNRKALLPTHDAIENARAVIIAARERLTGTMEIVSVLPD